MKISTAMRRLLARAKSQEDRAYEILGARPGPGIDLLVFPVEPMCGMWYCNGLTQAGQKFIFKFYMEQPFNNFVLARLKREAADWALKYQIRLPFMSLSEAALEPNYTPIREK